MCRTSYSHDLRRIYEGKLTGDGDFFSKQLIDYEKKLMEDAAKRGAECIRMIMAEGPDAAMNASAIPLSCHPINHRHRLHLNQ